MNSAKRSRHFLHRLSSLAPFRRLSEGLSLGSPRPLDNDLIDDAIVFRLMTRHVEIAIRVRPDPLNALGGVFRENLVKLLPKPKDLFRLDIDIRCLPLKPAHG